MEKLNLIINGLICNNHSTSSVDIAFLGKYYTLLEKYNYITAINSVDGRYNDFWDDFFLEYQLPLNCLYPYNHLTDNELTTFQKMFLSIINVGTNNRMKVIPLLIKFDLNGILTNYLLRVNFFNELEYKLLELIKCIQLTPRMKLGMSNLDHEYVLFNDYKRAQYPDSINFVKINAFIAPMNRGGKLNFSISLLNLLCPVLYKLNKNMFMELLDKDSDFMQYLALIHTLDASQQIHVALSSENTIVKFIVIWHINNYANNIKELYLYPHEVMNLAKVIISFSVDSHVWNEFINYVFSQITMNNNLHNLVCAFGSACNELEKDVVRSIFDKFPISKYIGFENIINNATYFVTSIIDSEKQRLVYELLYKRWEDFVDEYSEGLNNLLLTNLVNVIINRVTQTQSLSDIEVRINDFILLINSVDNIWFSHIMEQRDFIYKQLSKLFVYGYALKILNPHANFIKLYHFIKSITFLHDEVRQNEKTTLVMFNEYIFT